MTPIEEIERRILNFVVYEEFVEVEMEDESVIEIQISELNDVNITKGKLAEVIYYNHKE